MRKNIYDKDLAYTLLKPIVDSNLKNSYRKVEVWGKENIPSDGAILITPNHCNTLMDALVILRAFSSPTVFGARADMFNRPLIARIMYFLRILPMVRQRDGLIYCPPKSKTRILSILSPRFYSSMSAASVRFSVSSGLI